MIVTVCGLEGVPVGTVPNASDEGDAINVGSQSSKGNFVSSFGSPEKMISMFSSSVVVPEPAQIVNSMSNEPPAGIVAGKITVGDKVKVKTPTVHVPLIAVIVRDFVSVFVKRQTTVQQQPEYIELTLTCGTAFG